MADTSCYLILFDVKLYYFDFFKIRNVVKVIDFFSVTKSLALVIIIISGFVWLGEGKTENLTNLFDNTSDSPGNYALAFYAVLYRCRKDLRKSSISGNAWVFLDCLGIREMPRDFRNFLRHSQPIALIIST